jgi:hypothetical protein
MQENNKIYGAFLLETHLSFLSDPAVGFTITMYEFERTIETLWATVRGTTSPTTFLPAFVSKQPATIEFVAEHSEFVSPNSAMNFLSDNGGDRYNLCHCAFSLPPSLLSLSYSHYTSLE